MRRFAARLIPNVDCVTGKPAHVNTQIAPAAVISEKRPLVLIGGTAQLLNGWVGHLQAFSIDRDVLVFESRCQGVTTTLSTERASLDVHTEDIRRLLEEIGWTNGVDLCGFSFGGRLALAAAASTLRDLTERLVLTGVPGVRDARVRLLGEHGGGVLRNSADYLQQHRDSIPGWIEAAIRSNAAPAIHALVAQSHVADRTHPLHTLNLSAKVRCQTALIVGGDDLLSAPARVQQLGQARGWPVTVIPAAGHMVPLEKPREWRRAVVGFLDRGGDGGAAGVG